MTHRTDEIRFQNLNTTIQSSKAVTPIIDEWVNFWHVLVVSLSSYLLMKKKINQPFMSELHAKSWLLNIHQQPAVFFSQITLQTEI